MKDFITKEFSISIETGDRLFLFSDGLFEFFNLENEFYGNEKFLSDVKDVMHLQGSDFLNAVSETSICISGNIVRDDMTMLLINFQF